MSEPLEKQSFIVYKGSRLTHSGKRVYAYSPLMDKDGTELEDTEFHLTKKLDTNQSIGSIHLITQTEGGQFYIKGDKAPKYRGMFKDQKAWQTWSILDKEARMAEETTKLARKEMRNTSEHNLGSMTLSQLKSLYQVSNRSRKLAITLYLLEYLEGW